ncbi:hypothetical protein PENSPDRAFT_332828 [Peniophora sp. CONT]|nr:hypothetical protein PENSPDRAFT_332828 [Peniophora sp. CONT]
MFPTIFPAQKEWDASPDSSVQRCSIISPSSLDNLDRSGRNVLTFLGMHPDVFGSGRMAVLNPGVADPFEYGRYDLASRPSSDGLSLSMSMTVDETFDFMHRDSRRRQRVDSDASSFYFRPPLRHVLALSTLLGARTAATRAICPFGSMALPVSLYNRNFGVHARHGRKDSVSSFSSSEHQSASGSQRILGRSSWPLFEDSIDSMISDFSAMRVAHTGLSGDKMLRERAGHAAYRNLSQSTRELAQRALL